MFSVCIRLCALSVLIRVKPFPQMSHLCGRSPAKINIHFEFSSKEQLRKYIISLAAVITNCLVFWFDSTALEATIYRTRGEHASNYTTAAVRHFN
jgi:hypothetical protein